MLKWKDRYGHYPSEKQSGPFFPLFTSRESFDYSTDKRLKCNGDNMEDVLNDFKKSKPMFSSYEEFVEYIDNLD